MGFVYLIRNTVNGKCYVGQTRQRWVSQRWNKHKTRPEGILKFAFARHGLDKFEFSVICEIPNEELNDREVKEIAERETRTPNGYNIQSGGGNREMLEETKRKIGANSAVKLKGKKMPETTREALRKANTGRSAPLTEEHKQRVREGKRGVMKPVDQFTRDGVFVKAWESVRATGVSGVAECCNGWTKSAGRFVWKWRDPPEVLPPKPLKSAEQRDKMNERRRERRAAQRV